MPLYSDSNYFYSGGSTPLFSPYYPGASSISTSSAYSPYTSTYNRTIPGSYVVPISAPRSPSYSTHGLTSSSRYQPKLSTITESSPLISVSRHSALSPLTRINSPKYTSYTSSTSSTPIHHHHHTPKYTPPKPILINTADIDVSANRYRKRKEEALRQAQLEHESEMAKIMSGHNRVAQQEQQEEIKSQTKTSLYDDNQGTEEPYETHRNRSTIKRNRPVVRLSTIRSRSKERNRNRKVEDLYTDAPEPEEKKLKDMESETEQKVSETREEEPKAFEEVILELDSNLQTVRKLSIPQCPTFHDICEDISSDKIDDDLNAGALRRRASLIQEQQLLNEVQKSPSGTFQVINLERRDSHDSSDGGGLTMKKRSSKRLSKKGVTQTTPKRVELETTTTPKFTANVETVEEHHEIHKVFKLPKKKSVKKAPKVKEPAQLPEGFMSPLPKPQVSPKKKLLSEAKKPVPKTTAEIFTFDEASVEEVRRQEAKQEEEPKTPKTGKILIKNTNESPTKVIATQETPRTPTKVSTPEEATKTPRFSQTESKEGATKSKQEPTTPSSAKLSDQTSTGGPKIPSKLITNEETPKSPKVSTPTIPANKPQSPALQKTKEPLEKLNSLTVELKPSKAKFAKEDNLKVVPNTSTTSTMAKDEKMLKHSQSLEVGTVSTPPPAGQVLEKSNSITIELKTPTKTKDSPKPIAEQEKLKPLGGPLKTSQSLDSVSKPKPINKVLEKSNSITVELKSLPATPKTPQTPLKEIIPEEPEIAAPKKSLKDNTSEEPKVATPKAIRKAAIKKSDSGEDFWAQIGSRETLYMNKRKQELLDSLWEKREKLLESTTTEEVSNLDEIKASVAEQKQEDLKEAAEQAAKSVMERSNSNESALKKDTKDKIKKPEEAKERKEVPWKKDLKPKEDKLENKAVLPTTKIVTPKTPDASKTPLSPSATKGLNLNKKPEVIPPSNTVSMDSKETKTTTNLDSPTTTTTTMPMTKIAGQQAKSPERQEREEQKTTTMAKQTTQAKVNNSANKTDELDINKTSPATTTTAPTTTTTKTNDQQTPSLLAKPLTLTTNKTESNAKITAVQSPPQTAATKQAEVKPAETKSNAATAAEAKPLKKKTPTKTATTTPTKAKAKQSPTTETTTNVINADEFIAKAPAKLNASPAKQNANKKTPDSKKLLKATTGSGKVNAATKPSTAVAVAAPPASAVTSTSATTTIGENETTTIRQPEQIGGNKTISTDNQQADAISQSNTCGGNLSKFATVSNLAQCLQDVDADIEDYKGSSVNNSDENTNYSDDDSDFDWNSVDGWNNFTPSMKKKIKQRHRKEKQAAAAAAAAAAQAARFDPQKKVKIDTTRKLYVKEEAPRYPLVATPRPLWKREKIVYPDEDSDDDSEDSEESGSNEETDETTSDECTSASEEYEDELNSATASGGAGGVGTPTSTGDPNIIRMSTCSNDSGFEGGTAPSSPKKMLGARETRDSPSTPPSSNPAYKIEPNEEQEDDETSYTYSQFQKSGRFTPPATVIPRFKNYSVDDFHFLAVLGKGSFGKVLLAELRDTTYYYAVKCLKKDVVLEDDDVDSTLIERKVLALGTKHPYLCHLFCTFQTESHLFFVMEYLNGGDLMFHIQESGRFTEERARFYGAEIISGLKFLHKKGIIYRDLKLDNVLLDYEGHVRIADFGMCKLQIYLDKTADSFCGTPDYMAPEIIKGENYNQNVDWWSFGVLLYEMLIGQSPFSGCDEDELFWSICNEIPWFPVYISAEATSILKGLLEKDHTKRIGNQYSPAGDVVEHIFFRPIDWNLLEKRLIEPPFRPQVKHPLDTQYFDRVFTRERVRLTPIDKDILQSMDQKQFLGFTYTNPHITLDD
ncbi:protein kinase C delta isoform X2 [Musca autumnalis]|uniref:protein kinase C delta isoform X2 n=1 Tax=Musca autumnalis TaxID=221902 RepID=UPI003CEFF73F